MTAFQLIVLPALIIMIIATGIATARRRVAPRVGIAWIVLWLAAAIAVAMPGILTRLADIAGIGRGADLVLYVSILFMFVALFYVYLRFKRLDDQITAIVRHMAIREAAHGAESAGEDTRAPNA